MAGETTVKKSKKRSVTTARNRGRVLAVFALFSLLFCALSVRVGWHMVVVGDERAQMAARQQTKDSVIAATRGDILDANGNKLAISSTAYAVWVRPDSVKNNGKTEEEQEKNLLYEATRLSELLSMDYDAVYDVITSEKRLIRLAKNVDLDLAAEIRDEKMAGIELVETASRSYPLGSFASQLLGSITDDNVGNTGLERFYNQYLAGQNGRWITSKDNKQNTLSYGTNKYYSPEDGYTMVLTLDQNIQYIVEQKIAEGKETYKAQRVMCLVMDPKTGEIKAMAQTDEFDPNDPRAPMEGDEENFAAMTTDQKMAYWNKMWRCFCVSDTYEPGSTFKLMTTSIALDTGVTNMNEGFVCNGSTKVADWTLHCWNWPKAHGKESLAQAVQNSCNMVMVQLVQRIGVKRYYAGIEAFGITEKTGVDFPGEGLNIITSQSSCGPVELATMSYGQGIAVTPVSIVTAVCSLANEGRVMQPHFLKEFRDTEGKAVYEYEPQVKSISVSAQTAANMLDIMESVVTEGGAGTAKIPGYRVGGKTGTASKPVPGGYSKTDIIGSFIGVAPIDDPRFVCLVIVDTPRIGKYGSTTAAPIARDIMQSMLSYLDIQPEYSNADLNTLNSGKTTVPDVTGQSMEDAIGMVAGKELNWRIAPEIDTTENMVVVDQFPKAGEYVTKNSIVTLYYEFDNTNEEVKGPDTVLD
ncbi:MAG: PASTA domain-containing protein [Firmicutes bacterium]|nr:PASTA domain-containing protein [Bacillota bacterium]